MFFTTEPQLKLLEAKNENPIFIMYLLNQFPARIEGLLFLMQSEVQMQMLCNTRTRMAAEKSALLS